MQEKQNKTGLVWFRNNLRVDDNQVLQHAIAQNKHIIAAYCFDPRHFATDVYGFKKTEQFRAKFLLETIAELKYNLRAINIELFVFYYDQFLYHPDDIKMGFSDIPQVFTNFRKSVEKQSQIRSAVITQAAEAIKNIENNTEIPSLQDLGFEYFETNQNTAFPFKGGENSALTRLNHYFFKTKKLGFYKKTRNGLVGADFSSKFSPWLANGSISARTIYWKVKEFEKEHYKNQSTYWLIFELIWRDYFKYISLKHDTNIFKIGGILEKNYDWNTDKTLVEKWINGETQSAFVNANMIELKKTGWMSNRGRQNVASFFAKDLKLDWRIGGKFQKLWLQETLF